MANNPKHKDNLKPFKKGKDSRRNSEGRPKKIPALEELLADVLGEEKDGIEAAKAILLALRAKAIKGDIRAAEVLLDRAYGKAKQPIDHTSNGNDVNNPAKIIQFPDGTRIEL